MYTHTHTSPEQFTGCAGSLPKGVNLRVIPSLDGKESSYNAEDPGLIPGLGRSPREGNGNLLKHSCLENPMDRGAW